MSILDKLLCGVVLGLALLSCNHKSERQEKTQKEIVLMASKPVATSFLMLQLFADSTFNFRNSGIRSARNYDGSFTFHLDTLILQYEGKRPNVIGDKFLMKKTQLEFLNREGSLEIDSISTELSTLRNKLKES
jgi:hypothetical protein